MPLRLSLAMRGSALWSCRCIRACCAAARACAAPLVQQCCSQATAFVTSYAQLCAMAFCCHLSIAMRSYALWPMRCHLSLAMRSYVLWPCQLSLASLALHTRFCQRCEEAIQIRSLHRISIARASAHRLFRSSAHQLHMRAVLLLCRPSTAPRSGALPLALVGLPGVLHLRLRGVLLPATLWLHTPPLGQQRAAVRAPGLRWHAC